MPPSNLERGPEPDEVELSVFGPGIGESLALHFGDGQWMVVDSCLDRATGRPVAVEYFKRISVDVRTAVQRIIVTHWHDDHIGGVSEIAREAAGARISCSAALRKPEVQDFIAASRIAVDSPGGSELSEIFRLLQARKPPGAPAATVAPLWASAGRLLFEQQSLSGGYDARVWSLSPSDGAIGLSFYEVTGFLPKQKERQRRAVVLSPNRTSVVLWVAVGALRILLGGDLEEGGGPLLGWRAILASDPAPSGRAEVFKVAHHGSKNADHSGIWTQLLMPGPVAVVTPFAAGRSPLPTGTDVERIKARSGVAYCTGRTGGWAPPRRSGAVERTVREMARDRRVLRGPGGHIRLRSRPGSANQGWSVELFGEAREL